MNIKNRREYRIKLLYYTRDVLTNPNLKPELNHMFSEYRTRFCTVDGVLKEDRFIKRVVNKYRHNKNKLEVNLK